MRKAVIANLIDLATLPFAVLTAIACQSRELLFPRPGEVTFSQW